MKNVYTKLAVARLQLQQKGLTKSGTGGGFSYFELSDFLPSITEIFAELNLCSFTQINNESAALIIVDGESNSEVIFTLPFANFKGSEKKRLQEIQELGGSVTYLSRYLWLQAMNIVEPDTIDSRTNVKSTQTTYNAPKPAPTYKPVQNNDLPVKRGYSSNIEPVSQYDYEEEYEMHVEPRTSFNVGDTNIINGFSYVLKTTKAGGLCWFISEKADIERGAPRFVSYEG